MRTSPKRRWLKRLNKEYNEHLREAKGRLLACVVFFCLMSLVGVIFAEELFNVMLMMARRSGFEVISVSPGDTLVADISLVVEFAFSLALPFIAGQISAFVMPAFKRENMLKFRVTGISMIILFYAGVVFSF